MSVQAAQTHRPITEGGGSTHIGRLVDVSGDPYRRLSTRRKLMLGTAYNIYENYIKIKHKNDLKTRPFTVGPKGIVKGGINMGYKTCTYCKKELPATLVYFKPIQAKRKGVQSGRKYEQFMPRCKNCDNERLRAGQFKFSYGITIKDYDTLSDEQNGVCAICGKAETHTNQFGVIRLAVDHDHETGKVRGLLCSKCNFLVGHLETNTEVLSQALDYIFENKI